MTNCTIRLCVASSLKLISIDLYIDMESKSFYKSRIDRILHNSEIINWRRAAEKVEKEKLKYNINHGETSLKYSGCESTDAANMASGAIARSTLEFRLHTGAVEQNSSTTESNELTELFEPTTFETEELQLNTGAYEQNSSTTESNELTNRI